MQKSNCNSKLKDDDDSELESMSRASSPSSLEGGSNLDKSFPTILYGIVSDESSNDCINWHPDGRQFVITDKDKVSFLKIKSAYAIEYHSSIRAINCSF